MSSGPSSTTAAGSNTAAPKGYSALISSGATFAGVDQGIDFTGGPANVFALADGTVTRLVASGSGWPGNPGSLLVYKITSGPKSGNYVYTAEDFDIDKSLKVGSKVTQGQTIGVANGNGSAPGIECGWADSAGHAIANAPSSGPTPAGNDFNNFVQGLPSSGGGAPSNTSGGVGDTESIAKAAALSTFLNLPGVLDQVESLALKGERSLMNDQPLFPFIQQLCQASLRSFQSMPNGDFFAFYPDYFGGLNHRSPYWEIRDIEILDGTIQLSDDALATHVFVVGDTVNFNGAIDLAEKIHTMGVVNVINAFMANFITGVNSPALTFDSQSGVLTKTQQQAVTDYEKAAAKRPDLSSKEHAITFLQKYGARPYYEEAPMVRSSYFEMFLAFQRFCLLWSEQFLTTFTTTFMPELFPGGIVAFPDHKIQCFISEVSHECNYESGFVTRMNLIAPAAMKGQKARITDPSAGMVRAGIFAAPGGKNG